MDDESSKIGHFERLPDPSFFAAVVTEEDACVSRPLVGA